MSWSAPEPESVTSVTRKPYVFTDSRYPTASKPHARWPAPPTT